MNVNIYTYNIGSMGRDEQSHRRIQTHIYVHTYYVNIFIYTNRIEYVQLRDETRDASLLIQMCHMDV